MRNKIKVLTGKFMRTKLIFKYKVAKMTERPCCRWLVHTLILAQLALLAALIRLLLEYIGQVLLQTDLPIPVQVHVLDDLGEHNLRHPLVRLGVQERLVNTGK